MKTKKTALSKEENYILYGLGKSYQAFNKKFSNMPLSVTISKTIFLDLMISSKFVKKKERALYKNLESLEKKKYITYNLKELSFTHKGFKQFLKIDSEIKQYTDLIEHLKDPKTINLHKKLQTKLKN
jgi:DNA-binding PadR family transcriptional regulator